MTEVKERFITLDMVPGVTGQPVEVRFNMIEDEDGDRFWGYGHVPRADFVTEVNRWLVHCGGDPEWLLSVDDGDYSFEHLWARFDDDGGERFTLVDDHGNDVLKEHAGVFPVTRLTP